MLLALMCWCCVYALKTRYKGCDDKQIEEAITRRSAAERLLERAGVSRVKGAPGNTQYRATTYHHRHYAYPSLSYILPRLSLLVVGLPYKVIITTKGNVCL